MYTQQRLYSRPAHLSTQHFRRMFPPVRVNFGLGEPSGAPGSLSGREKYHVLMDVLPYDGKRYRYAYHKSCWQQAGKADPPSPPRLFLHPDGPFTLEQLRRQVISFEKIKLTNNDANKHGYIVLNSMHRYQPRIHLILYRGKDAHAGLANAPVAQLNEETCKTFIFNETIFTAVTAYQNHSITKLKIDSNPFAKGFRDSSRLTDFELESMQDLMSDGPCPFSPPRPPPHGFSQFLLAAAAQQNPHFAAAAAAAAAAASAAGAGGPEDPATILLRERTMMALDSIFQQQQQQQHHFHNHQQRPCTPPTSLANHNNNSNTTPMTQSNQNNNHDDSLSQSTNKPTNKGGSSPAVPQHRSGLHAHPNQNPSSPTTPNTPSNCGLPSSASGQQPPCNVSSPGGFCPAPPYTSQSAMGGPPTSRPQHPFMVPNHNHFEQFLQFNGHPLAAAMAAAMANSNHLNHSTQNNANNNNSSSQQPFGPGLFGLPFGQPLLPPPPPYSNNAASSPPPQHQHSTQSLDGPARGPNGSSPPPPSHLQIPPCPSSPCSIMSMVGGGGPGHKQACFAPNVDTSHQSSPATPPNSQQQKQFSPPGVGPLAPFVPNGGQQQQQQQHNNFMSQLSMAHNFQAAAPPGLSHPQFQVAMLAAAQHQQHQMTALSMQFEREHQLAAALARHQQQQQHHHRHPSQAKGAPVSSGAQSHFLLANSNPVELGPAGDGASSQKMHLTQGAGAALSQQGQTQQHFK